MRPSATAPRRSTPPGARAWSARRASRGARVSPRREAAITSPRRSITPRRSRSKKAARDPAQTLTHGQKELYKQRGKKLEKRIARTVTNAGERVTPTAGSTRGEHDLSTAEVHFNDAGRVSQKTLLAYAEEAARQPTTAEMYRNKDGKYHPSRAVLHAAIIDKLLRQHSLDEQGRDAGLSGDAPYLKAPSGNPTVVFTGGDASGRRPRTHAALPGLPVRAGLWPRAAEIAQLGAAQVGVGRTVAPAQALPVYLRDDVATPADRVPASH